MQVGVCLSLISFFVLQTQIWGSIINSNPSSGRETQYVRNREGGMDNHDATGIDDSEPSITSNSRGNRHKKRHIGAQSHPDASSFHTGLGFLNEEELEDVARQPDTSRQRNFRERTKVGEVPRPDRTQTNPYRGGSRQRTPGNRPSIGRDAMVQDEAYVDNRENNQGETIPTPESENVEKEKSNSYPVYANNTSHNCSACMMREELKKIRLESIKAQILRKLRLTEAPNVSLSNMPKIPQLRGIVPGIEQDYGDEDYMMMQGDSPYTDASHVNGEGFETDDFHSTTDKVLTFAEPLPGSRNSATDIFFNISDEVRSKRVKNATLYLYLRNINITDPLKTTNLLVSKIVPTTSKKGKRRISRKINLMKERGKWITVSVTSIVENWARHPSKNLGLNILGFDHLGQIWPVLKPLIEEENSYKPFLEISIIDAHSSRPKRMLGLQCQEDTAETRCCRFPLTVDFEAFNWTFILQPRRYEANYCSGECPFVFLQSYAHTHLLSMSMPPGAGGPCCSPTKVSSISMLYFSPNGNILYGKLPGMVVDRCGCS